MIKKILILSVAFSLLFITTSSHAKKEGAFYYSGDGVLNIGRGKSIQKIRFRNNDGSYNFDGLKKINNLYGCDWNDKSLRMSLRLIELLDYLEKEFNGKGIQVISGFRSQKYNDGLRKRGKIAASSSLHIDAEAIDIVMNGAPSSRIYDYLREQDCCGVGYYHGRTVHIDTGPPRFWDETSSGTEKKEPPQNEHIVIKTKSDLYNDGETVGIKFSRVNEYPIGVKKDWSIECYNSSEKRFKAKIKPQFTGNGDKRGCQVIDNKDEGRSISVKLPKFSSKTLPSKCRIRVDFCEPMTEKMPEFIESNPITVRK